MCRILLLLLVGNSRQLHFAGVIRTAGLLDREAVPHYWLTVYAKDLGTVPLVSWTEVYIEVWDINDNPPELSQPVYFGSVQENLPKDKSVLKVSATDMDKSSEGKLAFHILDSQRVYFTINAKTGKLYTSNGLSESTCSWVLAFYENEETAEVGDSCSAIFDGLIKRV